LLLKGFLAQGRWCDITVLNVHISTEDITEELEYVFYKFPNSSKEFQCQTRQKNIFKSVTVNECLQEISNGDDDDDVMAEN
jgi:hypothetical protein